jgi:hypothetical protein
MPNFVQICVTVWKFYKEQTDRHFSLQAYSASYLTSTGVYSPRGKKRKRREADHSPPFSAEVKNGGSLWYASCCV